MAVLYCSPLSSDFLDKWQQFKASSSHAVAFAVKELLVGSLSLSKLIVILVCRFVH